MILDMLKEHKKREAASFHMPGHKNGNGFLGTALESHLFSFDTTELCDTDALIQPSGAILEAEQRAASLYGARHSFYLVNGSTGGILAMLYAAFSAGDMVLVDRNCHQSVLHGCMLLGLQPVYITPRASRLPGLPGVLVAEDVQSALNEYPAAKGLIIASPTYYGEVADLCAISKVLHKHGALLLVDEAHGAHFPFSELFPKTAMEQGADLSVTSLHKTMSAPNQTALLHMSDTFEINGVRKAVNMFQTSSPSYLLLAAMEQALCFGAEQGAAKTEEILKSLSKIDCPRLDDPFKLLPNFNYEDLSSADADKIFREKFGIYAEMTTPCGLLLMVSWCNTQADLDLLQKALDYCNGASKGMELSPTPYAPQKMLNKSLVPLCDLKKISTEEVPFDAAKGRICASPVSAFPPCVPILLPGERIGTEEIEQLHQLKMQGATITGGGEKVSVLCESRAKKCKKIVENKLTYQKN
ncbi:MAG: aminotransferase class I/II-fold pyridoxal phosphate-dependent enzyme [Clostridia bacterium]|nr:aminotransferase class I/II-fold pyridoxal phosphate-dependent enzyme [Clostridia bacterium]